MILERTFLAMFAPLTCIDGISIILIDVKLALQNGTPTELPTNHSDVICDVFD